MVEEVDFRELRRELKSSVKQTLEKADYLTREEVEELVDDMVDEEAKPDEEVADIPEEEGEGPEDADEKGGFTHDELKENLPDDLWAEVKDHLQEPDGAFERAIKSLRGDGPKIVAKESDYTSGEEAAGAAMSKWDHREEGSSGR